MWSQVRGFKGLWLQEKEAPISSAPHSIYFRLWTLRDEAFGLGA
jgi:hypothetical protein